jgi:gluconokinase
MQDCAKSLSQRVSRFRRVTHLVCGSAFGCLCVHAHRELDIAAATEQQLFQRTGAPIHSAYAVAQLRVLYNKEPQLSSVTDQIVQWQTLPSLCLRRWTTRQQQGVVAVEHDNDNEQDQPDVPISYSEASWTGLLNFHTCQYETKMLDLLPESCRKALPKLADFDDDSWWRRRQPQQLQISPSFLGPRYANRWTMLQKARFFLGIGDGACANVGSKCWTPNRIACTVGTSAAARICLPLDTICSSIVPSTNSNASSGENCHASLLDIPSGLFCYRIDKSHILVGGALTDGGSVVEWATQLLNLSTNEDNSGNADDGNKRRTLRNCMDQVKTLLQADYDDHDSNNKNDSNMLVVAPFLSGERSTGYRSSATGGMLGLTRDTTPAHFLKASMEGVTLRVLAIIQLLLQCIPKLVMSSIGGGRGIVESCRDQERPIIMASGQALEVNGLWRQMIADSTGMDVVWDESTHEGTSRGVACLVAMALSASLLSKEHAARSADGNDNGIASAGRSWYLREEAVDQALAAISSPRGASAKKYWKRAAAAQNDLIHALSPLYSKEEA